MNKIYRIALVFVISVLIINNYSFAQQAFYDITPGNGNGLRLWSDNSYKIHMGSGPEYFFGPVQDFSIKMNMNGGSPSRGWTWGVAGQTPVAAINTLGNMQVAGSFSASGMNVVGGGTDVNVGNNSISGDMVIQSNTGGRSTTIGAQLEFAIPANTDGSNIWGQGRIITVAANTNSSNASGKMILGTRRYWQKPGTSSGAWYYGDDLIIDANGNISIGTAVTPGSYKLAVAGKIAATGEVRVFTDGTTSFPDYVFDPSYKLPNLKVTEKYVQENRHLPEVPSAKEIENDGMSLNEMNVILLKKVEELTLYMIEMKKENELMKARLENLEKKK